MKFNKMLFVIPVLLLLVLFVIRLVTNESLAGENEVFVSGTIEATQVDVSFKISGRIQERPVDEGDSVQSGQNIALLDNKEIMQQVALKNAELEQQEAHLLELKRGARPEEVLQAQARLRQAEADFERQKNDFARQKALFEDDVISSREFDTAKALHQVAEEKVKEARENYLLVKKGAREEKIRQAEATVKMAEEALNLAKTTLSETLIQAPISGYVISKAREPGEVIRSGEPIVTIANLDRVWLRAYISEGDLGKVKLGQKVLVKIDAFPGKNYEGKISYISQRSEFTPKNVQTEKERVKLVYRIKVDIENSNHELKSGMPATGLIQLS